MQSRHTIAVHGSYHTDNFGDVLLVSLYSRWIQQHSLNPRVVLPFVPRALRSLYSVDAFGVGELMRAHGLVYTGGGYFGEPSHGVARWTVRNIMRHAPVGYCIRARSRPYIINGVGAGPLTMRASRRTFVDLFQRAAAITVRDNESKEFLVSYGMDPERILVTADAAFMLSRSDIPRESWEYASQRVSSAESAAILGVHLAAPTGVKGIQHVLSDLKRFARGTNSVKYLLLCDSGIGTPRGWQAENAKLLKAELGAKAVLVPYVSPWHLAAILGEVDAVVTTKLHVGIVATALGSLSLAFPQHAKTQRLYRQIDAPERCTLLSELEKGVAYRKLNQLIEGRWKGYRLPDHVLDAAGKNRDAVHRFVDSVTAAR